MPEAKIEPLFAIVRVDKFQLADGHAPSDEAWRTIVTVKGLVRSREVAIAETARLNALNEGKGCVYLWEIARMLEGDEDSSGAG